MLNYSIAIRTLGTGGDAYRRQLESITRQSVQPQRVLVYIAEGYEIPAFRVGREEYVTVQKGMVAQRALTYNEISSDCILMLDDDVELHPDTALRMLNAMNANNADCVAADTFANHMMPTKSKLFAAAIGLVLPSRRQKEAFRIRRCGAFSYLIDPQNEMAYPSQSAAGPAAMWRKDSFLSIHYADEKWLEQNEYAYGDDQLCFYKLHANGGRLFVLFGSGAVHLDSRNSSSAFRRNMARRMYVRTKNTFCIWYRSIYEPAPSPLTAACFALRSVWNATIAMASLRLTLIKNYFRGLRDGIHFVRSEAYRRIPPYILKQK